MGFFPVSSGNWQFPSDTGDQHLSLGWRAHATAAARSWQGEIEPIAVCCLCFGLSGDVDQPFFNPCLSGGGCPRVSWGLINMGSTLTPCCWFGDRCFGFGFGFEVVVLVRGKRESDPNHQTTGLRTTNQNEAEFRMVILDCSVVG